MKITTDPWASFRRKLDSFCKKYEALEKENEELRAKVRELSTFITRNYHGRRVRW